VVVGVASLALMAAAAEPRGLATADWRLESVTLADGRRIDGLVEDPDPATGDVRVVQVVRPPGRPMYVVRWPPLQADRLESIVRLTAAEHEQLARRVRAFLDDRRRRGAAETAVALRRDHEDGPWLHDEDDFALTSTADSQVTRAAVVAIEQVLGALATLVPPGDGPRRGRITVRLCGSGAEYRQAQRDLGVGIDAPAFYVPVRGLIVAGGDLPAIAAAAAAEEETLAATAQGFERLDALLEERVRSLAAELESRGVGPRERADVVRRTRLRWERERTAETERITAARRANDVRLKRAWEMFRRQLAHETWHAYADTRLRHRDAAGLPIWLDEGLAQVVEAAPLEAGELRLDAPDPDRLAALQAAIRNGTAPAVADLLQAGQERFVGGHGAAIADRGLTYLAAWGLALDVAMLRPVLARDAVARMTADDDPVAAFEGMVGLPLDRYEPEWRRRILALRPGRRPEAEDPEGVTPAPSPAASPARSPP